MFTSRILRAIDHPYITGKGGRLQNNNPYMQGLTMKSIKHHKALQPLFAIIGGGMLFVAVYLGRLASKTTEINWSKEKDTDKVYGHYDGKQFKMFNPLGVDYSKYGKDRPNYRD